MTDTRTTEIRTAGTTEPAGRVDRLRVVRSRGSLSGALLVLLGLWGALIPFVGPYFDYAYTPATAWTWTWGRWWLEVLPGLAAIIGGVLLIGTANRAVGVFAGWLASAAGAWFVVGPVLSPLWSSGTGGPGVPVGGTTRRVLEQIGFFYGLGVVILFLAAQAVGRFTVRSVRDIRAAERDRERRLAEAHTVAGRPVTAEPTTTEPTTTEPTTTDTPTAADTEPHTTAFAGNRATEPARAPEKESGAGATRSAPPR